MSDTSDRCPRCDGTGIEPGSGDYDYTAYMVNPMTQEPCSVCHGTSAGYECDCDIHTSDLAQIRAELTRLRAELAEANVERDQAWREAKWHREGADRARDRAVKYRQERDKAEAQLFEVKKAKVWTNEDGKRSVFADDLAAILLPDLDTPTPTTRTETA